MYLVLAVVLTTLSCTCFLSGQNTGGYYKCNKYESKVPDKDSNNAVAKAKAELDRYLHYYQRYHGHDLALKFASKQRENAERRMLEMQASEKSAWIGMVIFVYEHCSIVNWMLLS